MPQKLWVARICISTPKEKDMDWFHLFSLSLSPDAATPEQVRMRMSTTWNLPERGHELLINDFAWRKTLSRPCHFGKQRWSKAFQSILTEIFEDPFGVVFWMEVICLHFKALQLFWNLHKWSQKLIMWFDDPRTCQRFQDQADCFSQCWPSPTPTMNWTKITSHLFECPTPLSH